MKNTEGRFHKVLFATDLDDTLLNRKKEVSSENREAIEYFQQEGGIFTYATGRSLQSFELPRKKLPESGPVILSNGSVIYDYQEQKFLYTAYMDSRCVQVAQEMIDKFPKVGMEFYLLDQVYVYQMNDAARDHLNRVGIRNRYIEVKNALEVPMPWIKGIFVQEEEILKKVETDFRNRYGSDFELVFSDPTLLEMQDPNGTKGNGILKLAQYYGIDSEHIYVAGDQQNDLSMLQKFQAFVPENATKEALAEADWIVSDCDKHSIAEAVRILEKRYPARI